MSESKPRKYFGTDGIRGRANNGMLNPFVVPRVGAAVGIVSSRRRENHRYRALIGKDTRRSNYMLEDAIISGLVGVGMDVMQIGPMTTPGVAFLTESMRADVGIMLTASHNGYEDNGIKLFGPNGYKFNEELELEVEMLIDSDLSKRLALPADIGRAKRIDTEKGQYKASVKGSLPKQISFAGMRVVVDCAHGAGYEIAPEILRELDADVFTIGVTPDGLNINKECGSTHPEALAREVRQYRADIGIALDGDGDRVLLVDERGRSVNGDQLLAMIACSWKKKKLLAKPVVVGTKMSNLGFERYLQSLQITLERTDVGDQHILRRMLEEGYTIGGEESGHVILSDHSKTGDGIVAALQAMAIIQESGRKASEVCHLYDPVPQVLVNVRFREDVNPLEDIRVMQCIAKAESVLNDNGGRLLVRKSGTEKVIRVMAEGDDRAVITAIVNNLAETIRQI